MGCEDDRLPELGNKVKNLSHRDWASWEGSGEKRKSPPKR